MEISLSENGTEVLFQESRSKDEREKSVWLPVAVQTAFQGKRREFIVGNSADRGV